ncbi:hypothetical protein BZG42_09810 [Streptococcus sp. DAT741]|uniref:hypothetical protein n=1 Tax=Streptococcus ruminantium TaxID=1917441 RepID=UPI0012DE9EC9|nr:hypothetical protein [Streptococcus ruminantium]QHF55607.1 hypothetical protein BZG42_09810 [Streptococcus sp. DAT741]
MKDKILSVLDRIFFFKLHQVIEGATGSFWERGINVDGSLHSFIDMKKSQDKWDFSMDIEGG